MMKRKMINDELGRIPGMAAELHKKVEDRLEGDQREMLLEVVNGLEKQLRGEENYICEGIVRSSGTEFIARSRMIWLSGYHVSFDRAYCRPNNGFVNRDDAVDYFPKYLESIINHLAFPIGLSFDISRIIDCDVEKEVQTFLVRWDF